MDRVTELIVKLTTSYTDKLEARNRDRHQEALKALSETGSPSIPMLMETLKDKNKHVRTFAAVALGKLHDPRAVPALIAILRDMVSFSVPQIGAWALGEIASHDPTPALRDALPTLRLLRNSFPVFQETMDNIEAATAGMKNLPLPSAAPLPDATSLPLPSTVPATSPDDLPIPSAHADEHVAPTRTRLNWFMREKGR